MENVVWGVSRTDDIFGEMGDLWAQNLPQGVVKVRMYWTSSEAGNTDSSMHIQNWYDIEGADHPCS